MDTLSLTWKSVTGRSAEMRQRFNSALHGAGSNLRRALLLQTVGISYQGRLHVCWITRAESFASAWNAGLEMSCCLLSNQNRLYGVCDTHLGHPENAACYHLYALGFFSSGVENKELCRQVETEKMWCGPTGFRNLRRQRGKTLWTRRFVVMWTTFLTLCLLCSSTLLWKQLQRTPVSLGQIFPSGKWSLIFFTAGVFFLPCSGCPIESLSQFRNSPSQDLCRRQVDSVCLWRTEKWGYCAIILLSVWQWQNSEMLGASGYR